MIAKIGKNNFVVNVKVITYTKLTNSFRERKFSPTLCQGYLDLSENLTVSQSTKQIKLREMHVH